MLGNNALLKKIVILLTSVFVITFLVSSIHAQGGINLQQDDDITVETVDGKEVIHTISEKPSEEDKDWPIIFHDTTTERDEKGQLIVVETTIRELRELDASKDCPEDETKQANRANCTYYGATTIEQSALSSSGITAYVKHFAYKYCDGPDCSYYRPFKVERRWTRPNMSVSITNARLEWGCTTLCLICGTSDRTNAKYNSSSMTPGWNNYNSYVYTTSISWFSQMQSLDNAHVSAWSRSNEVSPMATLP